VKLAKKIVAVGMLAFWAIMTNHCGLEVIPSLSFLACSPETEATQHIPSDCGDEGDACATIESGYYRSEECRISAGEPPSGSAFLLALVADLAALESRVTQASPEFAPPELAHVWQFSYRTALPPRAPSLLS
jgi:hypothetical protein